MPVGKGVNMRTLIEKKIYVEGVNALMILDIDHKTIRIVPDPNVSKGLAHVTNVLAFVLGDRDVKKMMSQVPGGGITKIKLVSLKGTYFIMKGGQRLLTTGKGFYFGSMPVLQAEDLYDLVQFLRKCGLEITPGKCDAGYRFI